MFRKFSFLQLSLISLPKLCHMEFAVSISRSEILKLLFALEKKGYVSLNKGKAQEIDVSLKKENLPDEFLDNSVFEMESKNISDVSKKVRRLAALTLDTMLGKIYVENGVRTWG